MNGQGETWNTAPFGESEMRIASFLSILGTMTSLAVTEADEPLSPLLLDQA